jgi:hypothetical protein
MPLSLYLVGIVLLGVFLVELAVVVAVVVGVVLVVMLLWACLPGPRHRRASRRGSPGTTKAGHPKDDRL